MKKRIFSILLIFLFILTSVTSAEAITNQDIENLYQHNLKIYNSKSSDESVLDFYKLPYYDVQSDNDSIVALAKSITEHKYSNYEKLRAIHNWVSNNIWYDMDSFFAGVTWESVDPLVVLKNKRSVCSGYAQLTVALLRAVDIPAKNVSGYANGFGGTIKELIDLSSTETNHAWCEAYVDGRWVIMDPTWNSLNKYQNGVYSPQEKCESKYFDISLKNISKDHRYADYEDRFYKSGFIISSVTFKIIDIFFEIYSATEITIPEGVKVIGSDTFSNCVNLKEIYIPDSVTSIEEWSFAGCKNLERINIPNGVKTVEAFTFKDCKSLSSINIPDSVVSIEEHAFDGCSNLSDVTIGNGVKVIGNNAFEFCESLSKIVIPNGVTSIEDDAFDCCYNLKSVFIPKSVTSIGEEVFETSLYNYFDIFIIYGEIGSYAETYARNNKMEFFKGTPNDDIFKVNTAKDIFNSIDTASDWAKDGIKEALAKRFVPDELQNNYKNIITRKEFCSIAVWFIEYKLDKDIFAIMNEKGVSAGPSPFDDTMNFDVTVAYVLGIVNGTGNGKFSPNNTITREQAATMIQNTCKLLGMDINNSPKSGFVDMKNASYWAIDGINFCRANGIMSGTGNNNFRPKQHIQESKVYWHLIISSKKQDK